MARVSDVQQLLGTLYAAPLQAELWNVFLQELSVASGVSKAALIAHDLTGGEHRMLATIGDTVAESVTLYENHFYQFDEWTARFSKQRRSDRFVQGEEIWPEALMRRSIFYNEFLEPFDVCQMACFASVGDSGRIDALSVYRGPHEDCFDKELFGLLQTLVPHLETALSTRRRLAGLEARVADLETAMDQLPLALVLLNSTGKCVLVNKAAQFILDQRNGLYIDRSVLYAKSVTESSRLRGAIDGAISLAQGKSLRNAGAVSVSRLGRKSLGIIAAPFKSGVFDSSGSATVIVFINDPEQKTALTSEVLRMLFALTTSEARLAITMLNGNSLSEAALIHQVGQETVRSQIKNIFQKTGTARQGELLQLLSGLTSPRR